MSYSRWNRIKRAVKRYPRHWYERARYGVSFMDLWSLDWYLAKVISRGCRELAENSYGFPPELTPEEWRDTLVNLAERFEAYNGEAYDQEFFDETFELFAKAFPHLWD